MNLFQSKGILFENLSHHIEILAIKFIERGQIHFSGLLTRRQDKIN